jgi:hypothetical protein
MDEQALSGEELEVDREARKTRAMRREQDVHPQRKERH